jgi:type IV pilus assembly protein PilC
LAAAAFGDALAETRGVSPLEVSIVRASERGGRLEQACAYLADYFATLDRTRSSLISGSLYPVFIFHLAIFLLALPRVIISGGGASGYLWATVGLLLALYAALAMAGAVAVAALRSASNSEIVDRLIGLIPLIGGVRRNFALARFCMTLDLQLEAGVNVMDSLEGAGAASQSALLKSAAAQGLVQVRRGERLGTALESTGAFPWDFARGLRIAEEAGGLDRELRRLSVEYQQRAEQRAAALSDWGSKVIYLAVVLYLGWQIVRLYSDVLKRYSEFL